MECKVTTVTEVLITCVTPPHIPGNVEVNVAVFGKGTASGQAVFTYNVAISSISHCSG